MPPKKKETNAVNEYDEGAWTNAFNAMTEEKKDNEGPGVATKDALAVIDKLLYGMQGRYEGHMTVLQEVMILFLKIPLYVAMEDVVCNRYGRHGIVSFIPTRLIRHTP